MNQKEFESLYDGLQIGDTECIKEIIQNGANMLLALTQCMSPDLVRQEQRDVASLMLELSSLIEMGGLQIVDGEK